MSYVLIGPSVSPWVKRARCFFLEKNVPFEVDPYAPIGGPAKPEFLDISPLAKIPALKHDEFAVADSLAICLYVEKLHPTPALLPSEAQSLARALWLCSYADVLFSQSEGPLFGQRVLRPAFQQDVDEAVVAAALQKLPGFLSYLNGQIEGRQYFVDETLSIADLTVTAVLIGLHHAQEPVDPGQYPALADHYGRITERESFQQLLAEDRAILQRMRSNA